MYRTDSPPFPLFMLYNNDVVSGVVSTFSENINLYVNIIGGVHYVVSQEKLNPWRIFIRNRNNVFSSLILFNNCMSVVNSILKILYNFSKRILFRRSKIRKTTIKISHVNKKGINIIINNNVRSSFKELKYSLIGVMYGIKAYRKYKRLFEQWYKEYDPKANAFKKNPTYLSARIVSRLEKSVIRKLLVLFLGATYMSPHAAKTLLYKLGFRQDT